MNRILTIQTKPDTTILAVEVPEDAKGFKIAKHLFMVDDQDDKLWMKVKGHQFYKDLPPGKYTIVGLLKEINEQVAAGLVQNTGTMYKDYEDASLFNDYTEFSLLSTAIESIHSAIRAAGGDDKNNYIILKKKV